MPREARARGTDGGRPSLPVSPSACCQRSSAAARVGADGDPRLTTGASANRWRSNGFIFSNVILAAVTQEIGSGWTAVLPDEEGGCGERKIRMGDWWPDRGRE